MDSLFYEIDIATNKIIFKWSALEHLDAIPLNSSVYPLGFEGFTGVNQSVAWGYSVRTLSPYTLFLFRSAMVLCLGVRRRYMSRMTTVSFIPS